MTRGEFLALLLAAASSQLSSTLVGAGGDGVSVTAREARLPGTFPYALCCGGFVGGYPADTKAGLRLYRVWDESPYEDRSAVLRITAARPSQEPIRLQYDLVAAKGSWSLGNGIFLSCRRAQGPDIVACLSHTGGKSCGFVAGNPADMDAGSRVYRRIYLFDPTVPAPTRGRTMHLGAMRFGLPHYHSVMRVKARRKWSRLVGFCPSANPIHTTSLSAEKQINAVRNVLGPVRSARDRVQISTRTRGPRKIGGTLKIGAWKIGEYSDIPEVS